ncbi:MAG: NfeD family protein, partial [Moraxellaceae bacterium]
MEFYPEPWHWVVLGIGLILFELMLPSFTALWFGVAAC